MRCSGRIQLVIALVCIYCHLVSGAVYGQECGANPMKQVLMVAKRTGRTLTHVLEVLQNIDGAAYQTLAQKFRMYAACVGLVDTGYFKKRSDPPMPSLPVSSEETQDMNTVPFLMQDAFTRYNIPNGETGTHIPSNGPSSQGKLSWLLHQIKGNPTGHHIGTTNKQSSESRAMAIEGAIQYLKDHLSNKNNGHLSYFSQRASRLPRKDSFHGFSDSQGEEPKEEE